MFRELFIIIALRNGSQPRSRLSMGERNVAGAGDAKIVTHQPIDLRASTINIAFVSILYINSRGDVTV